MERLTLRQLTQIVCEQGRNFGRRITSSYSQRQTEQVTKSSLSLIPTADAILLQLCINFCRQSFSSNLSRPPVEKDSKL